MEPMHRISYLIYHYAIQRLEVFLLETQLDHPTDFQNERTGPITNICLFMDKELSSLVNVCYHISEPLICHPATSTEPNEDILPTNPIPTPDNRFPSIAHLIPSLTNIVPISSQVPQTSGNLFEAAPTVNNIHDGNSISNNLMAAPPVHIVNTVHIVDSSTDPSSVKPFRISMKQAMNDPDPIRVTSANKAMHDEVKQLVDMSAFIPVPTDEMPTLHH